MNENLKYFLMDMGINPEKGVMRVRGKEALYVDLLKRFLKDENIEKLKNGLAVADYDMAFEAAHAIKGMAANLEMDSLYYHSRRLVEVLRKRELFAVYKEYEYLEKLIKRLEEIMESYA